MCTGELSPDIIQQGLVKRALDHLSEKDLELNYSNPYGSPGLRTAIQSYLKGKGIEVPISNILITSGALQALHLIASGMVPPKSRVYVESPSYLESLNIFQSTGSYLVPVPWRAGSCPG
ncbi:MAG: aminotransferase class I/II-fold pyridoxal phosphate-dependent enzyme [Enterocloster sp.]